MNLIRYAILVSIAATLVLTIAVYPALPPVIATHWNAAGAADGSMAKLPGLAIMPLVMLACTALFFVLPRIDPLKKNYDAFRDYYDGFILVFVLFMLAMQALVILWNAGHPVDMNTVFPVLFGLLFLYVGFLVEHAEPNWFVGIRTPWTLSSPAVWKKTHAVGGKLFKAAGVICFFGALAGPFAVAFILVPVIGVSVYTVVYSYIAFRDEAGGRQAQGRA
jgi:immunity protein, SdpI family